MTQDNITYILNNFLFVSGGLFLLSCAISLIPLRFQKFSHLATTIITLSGSVIGLFYSLVFFFNQSVLSYTLPKFFNVFDIVISINRVSAIFLALLFFVSFTSTLFGYNYIKHFFGKYRTGLLSFSYNLFIFSMGAVIVSQSVFPFVFFWELMSITSFFLIVFENDKPSRIKAGVLYLIFTQTGVLFIIAALLLLSQSANSQVFGDFANATDSIKIISTILLIIGFGAKAGLIPMHIWLPEAHPAAPSHASALISGVMLKVAIYAMIEFFLSFIPVSSLWIGGILIVIGCVTAVLGSLYSYVVRDIKRLVAYSSIDNMGIITIFLGVTLLLLSLAYQSFSANPNGTNYILIARLYQASFIILVFQIINHAITKSAIFQSTGVINNSFDTKVLDNLGGIARILPFFTLLFIIFSISISGLPPLNGFASEWLGIQNMISGVFAITSGDGLSKILLLISSVSIIFTGILTAGAYVKAIGVGFLGLNRQNINTKEDLKSVPGLTSYISLCLSAAVIIGIGLFSHNFVQTLSDGIFLKDPTTNVSTLSLTDGYSMVGFATGGRISPLFMLCLSVIFIFILTIVLRIWKTHIKHYLTWDCGRPVNSRMQYSAIGFSDNVRMVFSYIYQPFKKKTLIENVDYKYTEYLPQDIEYSETYIAVYNKFIYEPFRKFVYRLGNIAKKLQSGLISTYIIYMLITIIILLLIVTNV